MSTRNIFTICLFSYALLVTVPLLHAQPSALLSNTGSESIQPGRAPVPAPKMIFYWGEIQCDLSEENGYQNIIETTLPKLRKSIFSAPYTWTGKKLQDTTVFYFESIAITSIRGNAEAYSAFVSEIDRKFLQSATPGTVFHITGLQLGAGRVGTIRLSIQEEGEKPKRRNFRDQNRLVMMKNDVFDAFHWGPFVNNLMSRDFFTVKEIETTLNSEPFVEWNPYVPPYPLEVRIAPVSPDIDLPASVIQLDGAPAYSEKISTSTKAYRHLIQPGMNLELVLGNASQHSQDVRVWLQVVEDGDPRIQLRRDRNGHEVQFNWGSFSVTQDQLYLRSFNTPDNKVLHADRSTWLYLTQRITQSASETQEEVREQALNNFLQTRPSILVDGLELKDFTFDFVLDKETWTIGPGELLPTAVQEKIKAQVARFAMPDFTIQHIRSESGYDFGQMELFGMLRIGTPPLKKMEYYLQQPISTRITLSEPEISSNGGDICFNITLPEFCAVQMTVFSESGKSLYFSSDDRPQGKSRLHIPGGFLEKGKLLIVIDTPMGFVRQQVNWKG